MWAYHLRNIYPDRSVYAQTTGEIFIYRITDACAVQHSLAVMKAVLIADSKYDSLQLSSIRLTSEGDSTVPP